MHADRVRAQLDRLLASATFADTERASSFLRFIVDRALAGRTGEIKESVIAVELIAIEDFHRLNVSHPCTTRAANREQRTSATTGDDIRYRSECSRTRTLIHTQGTQRKTS